MKEMERKERDNLKKNKSVFISSAILVQVCPERDQILSNAGVLGS